MRPIRPLDPIEQRVLGCLLEKQQTTPEYYPLTLNALVAACNQKSNRDPVMELTPQQVREALERLRAEVLVWPVEGGRAERWEHNADRSWELDPPAKAVITELLLRGPETIGELRGRAARMFPFTSLGEVEAVLRRLAAGVEPLVVELPRQPGHKESRWAHVLGESPDTAPRQLSPPSSHELVQRLEALENRLLAVETELRELAQHLRRQGDGR